MTIRTANQFVVLCENRLGYRLQPRAAVLTARRAQARKVTVKVAENPQLYTWRNLELGVELLFRKRTTVKSPCSVFLYVPEAVHLAAAPAPVRPLADLIDEAIRIEMAQPSFSEHSWTSELISAVGPYRKEAYQEWLTERGHLLVGAR